MPKHIWFHGWIVCTFSFHWKKNKFQKAFVRILQSILAPSLMWTEHRDAKKVVNLRPACHNSTGLLHMWMNESGCLKSIDIAAICQIR